MGADFDKRLSTMQKSKDLCKTERCCAVFEALGINPTNKLYFPTNATLTQVEFLQNLENSFKLKPFKCSPLGLKSDGVSATNDIPTEFFKENCNSEFDVKFSSIYRSVSYQRRNSMPSF